MDVMKKAGGSVSGSVPDPLKPHSPMYAHQHMKLGAGKMGTGDGLSSGSESGSSSGEGESDVSDMVIDNSSKFAALSKTRRKSGESDYVPQVGSRSPESRSEESESESNSGQSEDEESDTSAESKGLPSKVASSDRFRSPSNDSDRSSNSSSRLTPLQQHRQQMSTGSRMSPLIKHGSHSPFTKANTRNMLNNVTIGKHNYNLCPPKRKAARDVKYTFYDNDSFEDEEEKEVVEVKRYQSRRRRRSPSGSNYEASDMTSEESSGGRSFVVDEDDWDEDYAPKKRSRRAGGRGRRGRVREYSSEL